MREQQEPSTKQKQKCCSVSSLLWAGASIATGGLAGITTALLPITPYIFNKVFGSSLIGLTSTWTVALLRHIVSIDWNDSNAVSEIRRLMVLETLFKSFANGFGCMQFAMEEEYLFTGKAVGIGIGCGVGITVAQNCALLFLRPLIKKCLKEHNDSDEENQLVDGTSNPPSYTND